MKEMSALSKGKVAKEQVKACRKSMREALGEGRFVAISDACIDRNGQGAIAWGIWSDKGVLIEKKSKLVELSEERSSTQAEALGALEVAKALVQLGIYSALCFVDCAPAIARLKGLAPSKFINEEQLAVFGSDSYHLQWAPREALGPANDLARYALGLRPEKSMPRSFEDYAKNMQWSLRSHEGSSCPGQSKPSPKSNF